MAARAPLPCAGSGIRSAPCAGSLPDLDAAQGAAMTVCASHAGSQATIGNGKPNGSGKRNGCCNKANMWTCDAPPWA
jgi:hypothetical protein